MRKFIFNSAMIGVFAGAWNVLQATKHGPRDWRLMLLWAGWILSGIAAVGNIIEEADDRKHDAAKERDAVRSKR